MATRFVERSADPTAGYADVAGNVAPIGVDSDSEELKYRDKTAGSDRTVVTTDQTQTLTNKTLTSPVVNNAVVDVTGAAVTIDPATHGGKTLTFNRAGGVTATLPAATGSGLRFRVRICTASAAIRFELTGDDVFHGSVIIGNSGDSSAALADLYSSDGATHNLIAGTVVGGGGNVGDVYEFEDADADQWHVTAICVEAADPASPFAAT